ncbi:MAG: type IX secretion system sortase PorU [Bacteroidota bacterium]
MGIRLALFLILLVKILAFGQSGSVAGAVALPSTQIIWQPVNSVKISETEKQHFLSFDGATYEDDFLPRYNQKVAINANEESFFAVINNPVYGTLSDEEIRIIKNSAKITADIRINASVCITKKQKYGVVSFIPIRKNNTTGKFEKLLSFDISVMPGGGSTRSQARGIRTYAANSVLQNGTWHKMAIATDGIYKLSYSFLQSIGIDVSAINPQNIRIYGNGGGMVPELNSIVRPDDLVENAIIVQGEADGVFDINDYVLFYGKSPHTWQYNSTTCSKFTHTTHLYCDSAYYFITTDLGAGKRIQTQASSTLPVTHSVTTFDDHAFHENDNINFIKSGRRWYGEYFDNITSYNLSFSFPYIDGSSSASVKASIASRYINLSGSSYATYFVSSQSGKDTIAISETGPDAYSDYAIIGTSCYSFTPSNPIVTVNVAKQTADAIAWLDYIDVNVRRQLIMSGDQLLFRDAQSMGAGNVAEYTISSNQPIQIWDISEGTNIRSQILNVTGTNYQFILPADSLKQFIAFTGLSFKTPSYAGMVANQNLHALSDKDFIIVVHPDFYNEATQLAAFHENVDTLSTIVVTTQQIYNEFSSGAVDVSAIRDFVKMFYDKAAGVNELPQYLLLFGDGSYDNKRKFSNNTNLIPTYQSDNSTVLTRSYVSDDFFGLLDDSEGLFSPSSSADVVDIGIGRFPVKSKSEAQTAINKILSYVKTGVPPNTANNGCSSQSFNSPYGDWRNMVCFIADDEDGGLHEGVTGEGADQLATMIDTTYDNYNIDKIYLDAYRQESTPGGQRYPGVNEAINKRMDKGCLIMNYTGHGGEVGLAHERVVEVAQINKWNNANNLPLFFTATCEFARYDDPERTSAGEYVFLNPNGGGIALFTTVRLVFASPNFYLNKNFYKAAFEPINGKMPRLGDLYQYMKAQPGGNSVNSRNFTLLGDPALMLAYPKYNVTTDTVNAVTVSSSSSDTLKALSTISVSGYVRDNNNNILSGYNGVLYPTVYDKPQNITTLSNDPCPPSSGETCSPFYTFKLQKNILYKGKVSVINGHFNFSFVVPKDIAYQYGVGRISYYAENGSEDANGYYEKIIIGGSNDAAPGDVTGPEINLYMNDNKFVFGGLTNENPDLFAVLKDVNGINTVGNGIGHDITAVLDANTDNVVVLNDYYQADLNSYKSGTLRYRYSDLSEGKHTLKLKVWDVYNNSSESYTEFIVAKSAELALSHVLNYPNPFTTKTQFYFEQNQCCQLLDVQVQVFTISGKLVKSIAQYVHTEGFRSEPIEWDGRDDFGDKIGKGVYIYRIKVRTSEGSTAEKYEKLVILN